MAVHVGQMTSIAAVRSIFDAITVNSAKVLGLDDYGLAVGCHADFVVLQARDPIEAIRLKAHRLAVVRRGKLIAQSAPKVTTLMLNERPQQVDASLYAPPLIADKTARH
jgi:cytosine deaminase